MLKTKTSISPISVSIWRNSFSTCGLVARVGAEGMDLAALLHDLRHQMLQLVGAAARHDGGVALAREATGDRAARRIAGADHDADLVLGHGVSPSPPNLSAGRRRLKGD